MFALHTATTAARLAGGLAGLGVLAAACVLVEVVVVLAAECVLVDVVRVLVLAEVLVLVAVLGGALALVVARAVLVVVRVCVALPQAATSAPLITAPASSRCSLRVIAYPLDD